MNKLITIGRVATTGSSLEGISHVTAALLKSFDIHPANLEAVFDTLVGTSKDSGLPFKTLIKQLPALSQSMEDLGITGFDGLSSLMSHVHLAMQHSQANEFPQEMVVSLEELSQAQAQFQKHRGLIDVHFNAMMKTAIAQTIQLDIATKQLGLTFAEVFGPSLTPVIQNMTTVIHQCKKMMTDYPVLTQLIGTATLGLGAFATALSVVTAMQWLWNAASFANPIGIVIAGISASVVMLIANLNTITSTFNTLKDS